MSFIFNPFTGTFDYYVVGAVALTGYDNIKYDTGKYA